jgi:hypothetical protein
MKVSDLVDKYNLKVFTAHGSLDRKLPGDMFQICSAT